MYLMMLMCCNVRLLFTHMKPAHRQPALLTRFPFRVLSAAVLLFAATMKLLHPPDRDPLTELFAPGVSSIALILGETALAAWLMLEPWRYRRAQFVAAGTFLPFSIYSAWRWWQGEASCGCFGRFQVPPQWMALADLALAIGLGGKWRKPLPQKSDLDTITPRHLRRRWGIGCAGVLLAALAAWVFQRAPGELRLDPEVAISIAGSTTVSAAAQAAPQVMHAKGSTAEVSRGTLPEPLNQGSWIVVGFRDDCKHCQETVSELVAAARRAAPSADITPRVRWAFINFSETAITPGILDHFPPPGSAILLRQPDPWRETPVV